MDNTSKARADQIFERFKTIYPELSKQVTSYHMDGRFVLAMKLADGGVRLWDEFDRTLRRLPSNFESMSDEQYRQEIGRRLYKIMYRNSVTQEQLASMTGIAQSQLSGYISGRVMPNFRALDKIARALHISLDELRYVDEE